MDEASDEFWGRDSTWRGRKVGRSFLFFPYSPRPASRRPSPQLRSIWNSAPPPPDAWEAKRGDEFASFWIDSKRLARSGVFLICARNSFSCGCLSGWEKETIVNSVFNEKSSPFMIENYRTSSNKCAI